MNDYDFARLDKLLAIKNPSDAETEELEELLAELDSEEENHMLAQYAD